MSASRPDTVREALLDAGHPPEEPVCLVHAAGAPDQKILRCSLLSLGDTPQNSPLITIAGPVASLAAADERILYTGLDPRHIQLPGRVHHVPFIRVVPLSPDNPPDTTAFDGIIFTSQQAVEAFFRTHRPTSRQQVFAIGPVTSRALHARGIRKITIAPRHDSDSLAELIATAPRCSLLYPCSNRSNNILHSLDTVTPVVWYRVENRLQKPFDLSSYYGIVFSSPSTVHSFLATFTQLPSDTILYVLGEKTRNALLNNGAQERMIVTVSIH
jgi:uroporphyrinogen-III synthase